MKAEIEKKEMQVQEEGETLDESGPWPGQYEQFLMMGKPGMTLDEWMEMSDGEKDKWFLVDNMEMKSMDKGMAMEKRMLEE